MEIKRVKKFGKYALAILFIIAGINHFITPDFYVSVIPGYLPFPAFLTYFSGLIEILLGIGLIVKRFRRKAAWAIIFLMILFIPIHIYVIEIVKCPSESVCIIKALAWIRLLLIQPFLIFWAWIYTK